jgi:hypothetical protein
MYSLQGRQAEQAGKGRQAGRQAAGRQGKLVRGK